MLTLNQNMGDYPVGTTIQTFNNEKKRFKIIN